MNCNDLRRARSSRCGGMSLHMYLRHSWAGWVGRDRSWNDSGCQRRLYMLTSDLTHVIKVIVKRIRIC